MQKITKLLASIVGCELVGIIGGVSTTLSISTWYVTLEKPFFSPPNWLFGPVWTTLYLLMGVSFFLLWQQGWKKKQVRTARNYFLAQLGLNFIWTPVFFGLRSPALALVIILGLLVLIVLTIKHTYKVSRWAAYLLVPYLLWVSFATALNAAIVGLNYAK
ncbi:MAG: tryptophan-rich sensory protein [bacterium]|nr:tryptophan-rich sensory protein [bacterium]